MTDYTDSPEGQYELGRAEYEERCRDREIDALRAEVAAAHAAGFREGVEASARVVERYGCCDDDDCAGDTVWLSREIRALAPAPAKDGEGETP